MIETGRDVSRLSAFVTLKRMYNGSRTKNAVLSEFIYYVLKKEVKISSFSSSYIKEKLESYFGFIIPLGVIENSLCRMEFVTRTVSETNPNAMEYIPKITSIQAMDLDVENHELDIINEKFEHFCKDNKYHYQKSFFEESLCKYLLDEKTVDNLEMREAISLFICSIETDRRLMQILNGIKEGAILYLGLNYDIPSVKKKINLTIYLDTEVIFDLVGYNGELYKELAIEFVSLIKNLNSKGHMISLRILPEIEKEINNYFYSATDIVSGKSDYYPRIAMRNIVDGCKEPADVQMKKVLFDRTLRNTYGIEVESFDFYDKSLDKFNLETSDYSSEYEFNDLRIISHINKLRQGKRYKQVLNSDYMIVTETGSLLSTSEVVAKNNNTCEYAIRIGLLTNLLWYYQCQGLGGSFPQNANVAVQAKTILSRIIDTNVSKLFDEAKNSDYSPNDIDIFIESFHSISKLPEQINQSNGIESVTKSKEGIKEFYSNLEKERETYKETERKLIDRVSENELLESTKKKLEEEIVEIKLDSKQQSKFFSEENEKKIHEIRKQKKISRFLLIIIVALCFYIVIDKTGWASIISQLFLKNKSKIGECLVKGVLSIFTSLLANYIFQLIGKLREGKNDQRNIG